MHRKLLELLINFEWDKADSEKSYSKHNVHYKESEEVFINDNLLMVLDIAHSQSEERHYVFGKTNGQRKLVIAFTVMKDKIRVIMARDMSKKERIWYEKEIKKNS